VSSRQEEKERRRLEREEAERAAASSSARRKRLSLALGGALAVAIAVIVALAVASGNEDEGPGGGAANVPTQGQTNEAEAARAAGCELRTDPVEGRDHTGEKVTYRSNPPTSGDHDPLASQDGIYESAPDLEQSVHALEHGRINVQYKPGTPKPTVDLLTALVETYEVKGTAGYKALLFPNQTSMQPAVAATAWTKSLTCPTMNDRVYDAIRTFWKANVDKGPEFLP
jgi:hypothetical protein